MKTIINVLLISLFALGCDCFCKKDKNGGMGTTPADAVSTDLSPLKKGDCITGNRQIVVEDVYKVVGVEGDSYTFTLINRYSGISKENGKIEIFSSTHDFIEEKGFNHAPCFD